MSGAEMEETHSGYKLLRGVRRDIKTLLTNFEKTESVRFADFCNEWKKMKFSLIFMGRKHLPELLEFTEETIHIAKGYLSQLWPFHTRVGALYLLYGLFYKQIIKRAAKIRLTKDEWEDLCDLVEKCKEAQHYDCVFIHFKMYVQGAYVFTVVPRATGLERGFRKYEEKCKTYRNVMNETVLNRTNVIDPELLESLMSMESLYSDKKSELLGKKNLEFVDKGFAISLKTKLQEFYSNSPKDCASKKIIDESDGNVTDGSTRAEATVSDDSNKIPKTIGSKRLEIRKKAFAAPVDDQQKPTGVMIDEQRSPRKRRRRNSNNDNEGEDESVVNDTDSQTLSLPII